MSDDCTRTDGWRLSRVMESSSGRPYASLLSPACTSATRSFSNCGLNVNGYPTGNDKLERCGLQPRPGKHRGGYQWAGPTPGIGLNSFYGPWLERVDVSLGRRFSSGEGKALQLQVQAFKLLHQANFYVRNGDGINQLQYTRLGPTAATGPH